MNNIVYENSETKVMAFLSNLIENAIDPYKQEIEGNFKLKALRQKLENSLKGAFALISAWGFSDNEARLRDISILCAKRMCAHINDEVFALFRNNSSDGFFMIDFNAFSGRIANVLNYEFSLIKSKDKKFLKN